MSPFFRDGRRIPFLGAMGCLVLAVLLVPGCGKKGDPVPPRHQPPPVVQDLKGRMDGERLTLTWTVPAEDAKQGRADEAVIYRFRSIAGDAICPGCPPVYVPVATVDVDGGGAMAHGLRLEEGYRYMFKVVIRGSDGVPGEDSDPVQIQY